MVQFEVNDLKKLKEHKRNKLITVEMVQSAHLKSFEVPH